MKKVWMKQFQTEPWICNWNESTFFGFDGTVISCCCENFQMVQGLMAVGRVGGSNELIIRCQLNAVISLSFSTEQAITTSRLLDSTDCLHYFVLRNWRGQRTFDTNDVLDRPATKNVHIARHDLWSHCDLCVVQQHGVLCEVKWWRFFALFE